MDPIFIADGAVAAGAEKSNRSADALGAGCDAVDENTSPNPPNPPVTVVVGFGAGGDFGAGSKNDPPPSGGGPWGGLRPPPPGAPKPPVSPAHGAGARRPA